MTTLDQILSTWEKDSIIDKTDPGGELINIPKIHAKYVRYLSEHSLAAKKAGWDLNKMKKIKIEYYNGRLDAHELKKYGWEPFKFILKADIAAYLEADQDIINIQMKKALHDETIAVCNFILKELSNRTWQLKEYCSWEKFINGQH